MEPSADTETQSTAEEQGVYCGLRSSEVAHKPASRIISIQLLEFKTSLLEAVEELHIHRDAEMRYEAQICELVLEKQELEWQKESLQSQINKITNEHSESLAAVKRQLQAQIRGIEEEKGKLQLSAELKDKESSSLKEELKSLQLFKYSLEKKLSELEQKLQLQTQVKDRHLNQLGEVEKRFGAVSRQCAMVKKAHEKLEQNVEEAKRLNKKFALINKKQESTIAALKKDVERLNSELVKCKVVSLCKSGEESSNSLLKEQQLQELQQKLIVEKEMNKKLRNENTAEKAEKKELISSLQHAQMLLQTQTQAVCRTEQQLLTLTEKYQVLKREHEMIQERSKEKEDRLMRVIEEHKNSKLVLEKEMQILRAKMQIGQEELKTVQEAYDHLHEKNQQLSTCAMHQSKKNSELENGLEDGFNYQKDSPSSPSCDVHLNTGVSLSKDASLDTKVGQISLQNDCEQMRHCKDVENIPDERTVECQEAAKDGCFHEENVSGVNVCSQTDQTVLELPASQSLDVLAPDQSERSESISGAHLFVTNLHIDPVVKQEATVIKSAPVRGTFDNGCPSNTVQIYTGSCLTKLSEPETRSVYGVASDPLMSEPKDMPEKQRQGVSEMREHQTSDKHTSETSQDTDFKEVEAPTTAPDTNSPQNVSPNKLKLPVEIEINMTLQDKDSLNSNKTKQEQLEAHSSTPQITTDELPTYPVEKAFPSTVSVPDKSLHNPPQSNDQFSQLEPDSLSRSESLLHPKASAGESKIPEKTEAKSITEEELNASASHAGSFSQNNVNITLSVSEAPDANEIENSCAEDTSALRLSNLQGVDASQTLPGLNSQEDAMLTKQSDQLTNMEKQITEPSYLDGSKSYGALAKSSMSQKETLNTSPKCMQSAAGVSNKESKNDLSATSRPSISEQKSIHPSGFQDLLSTMNTPLFLKHKLKNRGDSGVIKPLEKLNVSTIHPNPKTDHHGEWNAIKQTFSEISVEKENRVPISFGSAQLDSPAARSVGNGLRQDCTLTPPPKLHGLGKVSQPVSEGSTPTPPEKEKHLRSDIRAQIAKIEQFLSSEGFRPQKRRKIEEFGISKP